MALVTGIIYYIFNATYLKKRSQLRDNNTEKKLNSPEKHVNNINLDEKSQDEIIKENEKNLEKNNSIDNKGIWKKSQNYESSEENNKENFTEIKVIENAENIDQNEQNAMKKFENKSTTSIDTVKAEKDNIQETCFTDSNQTDNPNQCEIKLEDK